MQGSVNVDGRAWRGDLKPAELQKRNPRSGGSGVLFTYPLLLFVFAHLSKSSRLGCLTRPPSSGGTFTLRPLKFKLKRVLTSNDRSR